MKRLSRGLLIGVKAYFCLFHASTDLVRSAFDFIGKDYKLNKSLNSSMYIINSLIVNQRMPLPQKHAVHPFKPSALRRKR